MTDFDSDSTDDLMDRLRQLDPTHRDLPPEVGSTRFISVKDTVMGNTEQQTSTVDTQNRTSDNRTSGIRSSGHRPIDSRPIDSRPGGHNAESEPASRRRLLPVAAAVAVVAVVAALAALVAPGSTPSAAATVQAAADNIASVQSFRMAVESVGHSFPPGGQAEGEFDGGNMAMKAEGIEIRRVDDVEWIREGGDWFSQPAVDEFDPFGEAGAAVITAALTSDSVTELGEESIGGIATLHYRIELDETARAELAQVPSSSQYWFVIDASEDAEVVDGEEVSESRSGFLEDTDSIDVWVADDLVHRLSVVDGDRTYTFTFSDFGADITIEAPQ